MTRYYKVLRRVTSLDREKAPKRASPVLKMLPPSGYVTTKYLKDAGIVESKHGTSWACKHGILEPSSPDTCIGGLGSVKRWISHLKDGSYKHGKSPGSTRRLYLGHLATFSRWLEGREFEVKQQAVEGGIITTQRRRRTFADVEDLLNFCEDDNFGVMMTSRIVSDYLNDSSHGNLTKAAIIGMRTAVKSYFRVHGFSIDAQVNLNKHACHDVVDDAEMNLEDFYNLVLRGRPSPAFRAIMLIQFQGGMDVSTFADRFNYEAYPQMVEWFGTDERRRWDLNRCPVPLTFVRMKTAHQYTTFIDRDAVEALLEYLDQKEERYGKHNPSDPIFLTSLGTPVRSVWISNQFAEVAKRAGMQKKVRWNIFKMRAHGLRTLLKSSLEACGCAPYAADHVIGHKGKDRYQKPAELFPQKLREEYSKGSEMINLFSRLSSYVDIAGDSGSLLSQIAELKDRARVAEGRNVQLESQLETAEKCAVESKTAADEARTIASEFRKRWSDAEVELRAQQFLWGKLAEKNADVAQALKAVSGTKF